MRNIHSGGNEYPPNDSGTADRSNGRDDTQDVDSPEKTPSEPFETASTGGCARPDSRQSNSTDSITQKPAVLPDGGEIVAQSDVQNGSDKDTATSHEPDLTAFQEQCLIAIARHHKGNGYYPKGKAIKGRLEQFYTTDVNHGRLYPNLDDLQKRGLVEKHERDRRTNEYHLTTSGKSILEDRLERLKNAVGEGGDV